MPRRAHHTTSKDRLANHLSSADAPKEAGPRHQQCSRYAMILTLPSPRSPCATQRSDIDSPDSPSNGATNIEREQVLERLSDTSGGTVCTSISTQLHSLSIRRTPLNPQDLTLLNRHSSTKSQTTRRLLRTTRRRTSQELRCVNNKIRQRPLL